MGKRRDAWSAGHGLASRKPGQTDPGAMSQYGVEATEARALTLHLAQDSAALNIPTLFRDTGPYSLADDASARFGATRFREVHFNAGSKDAHGVEVLVGPNATDFEKRLAIGYAAAIATVLGIPNRGVKVRDDLAVLHQYASMASVLIEVGFITSRGDMAAYHAKAAALELALVNVDRAISGSAPMKKLPRLTWRKVRISARLKTV